jgi:hypothetical protein
MLSPYTTATQTELEPGDFKKQGVETASLASGLGLNLSFVS